MIKNQFIKKITAALMLIVFAVSITPLIVFHDAFASHTDSVKKTTDSSKEQVGKKLFNCDCNDIVATSPFADLHTGVILPAAKFYALFRVEQTCQFKSGITISHSLRGPPSV